MTVKLFSRFSRPVTTPAPFGSGVRPVFEEKVVDGRKCLVKIRDELISPMIQEFKEETLVYNILARYQRGDLSALDTNVGQFLDVVGMPLTLAEAQQKLIDVRNRFDQMPLDIRRRFNNSVDEFVEAVSNGDVTAILADLVPEKVDEIVSPTPAVPAEPVKE